MTGQTERIAILLQLENEKFEKNAKTAAASIDRLERRFDPLAAAEQRMQKEQTRLNAALEAGTLTTKRHATGMDLLQREYDQTVAKVNGARSSVLAMNSSVAAQTGFMTRNRAIFQQGGYQVGDFAVQVQGGTSALTAFTQQGSQLLGVLGPWGAVMGAVLAVGAPLAGIFLANSDAGMKFKDALEGIQDVTATLQEPLDQLNLTAADMKRIYGTAADKVRELIQVQSELRVAMAEDMLQSYVMALDDVLGKYTSLASGGHDLRNTLSRLQKDFGLTEAQAVAFEAALQSLNDAGTLDDQKAALQDILKFIEANNISLRDMPPALREALDEMITLSNESDKAAQIAAKLAESDFGESGIAGAASEAVRLAQNLGISLDLAQRLEHARRASERTTGTNNNGLDPTDPRNPSNTLGSVWTGGYGNTPLGDPSRDPPTRTSRRGGGGRGRGSGREQEPLFTIAENELQKLKLSIQMLGKSKGEIAALTVKQKLLDEAKKRGLEITEELTAKIDAEAKEVGELADQYDQARDKIAALEKIQGTFKDSIIDAAMGGVDAMDAFTNSIKRAAIEYLLFGGGLFSGGSISGGIGGGGGLIGVLGGILGFEGGGYTGGGARTGGVDGKGGFPAILHPQETVIDHTKGQINRTNGQNGDSSGSSASSGRVEILIRSEPGTVAEIARNEAGALITQAAPSIVGQAVAGVDARMKRSKSFGQP